MTVSSTAEGAAARLDSNGLVLSRGRLAEAAAERGEGLPGREPRGGPHIAGGVLDQAGGGCGAVDRLGGRKVDRGPGGRRQRSVDPEDGGVRALSLRKVMQNLAARPAEGARGQRRRW